MSDLDTLMPKLSELEVARILDHFRDCGADPKAVKKISGHITRLSMEIEAAKQSSAGEKHG